MILHNTTFVITPAIELQFLHWIRNEYLPAIQSEDNFHDPLLTKIKPHASVDEEESLSYALQFKAADEEAVNVWFAEKISETLSRSQQRFGENMLMFSTIMEIV